jgi:hypothetical protein
MTLIPSEVLEPELAEPDCPSWLLLIVPLKRPLDADVVLVTLIVIGAGTAPVIVLLDTLKVEALEKVAPPVMVI